MAEPVAKLKRGPAAERSNAGRPPSKRYSTKSELREATRAECEKRVNAWAGREWWNERDLEYLKAHSRGALATPRLHGRSAQAKAIVESRKLHAELVDMLQRVSAFARKRAQLVPAKDGPGLVLRQLAAESLEPLLRRPELTAEWRQARFGFTTREALVADFDCADQWWWRDRRPRRTELAVLSLLAGNWPDTAAQLPSEVIAAEAKNIDTARKALGLSRTRE